MEMQFDRISLSHLQKVAGSLRTQEQTLEVRLPEGMPDVGHILGAWGQVVVRGKEWNGDSLTVPCGVMAWVLYMPEDEDGVYSVEAWLPFTMKWDLPDTRQDGKILVSTLLKGVDARSVSAGKLMVRASMEAVAEAWLPAQTELPVPSVPHEDVQMLQTTYPVVLPREAGEKAFVLEENLSLPANGHTMKKLMYYTLQPEILDKKVMAGKVVFRGNGMLHLLYLADDGRLYTCEFDLPFSQYADLEGEYDEESDLSVYPCVTSLDVSVDENGELIVKAGLLGQYLLSGRTLVTAAQDAYSPHRKVVPVMEELFLPAVLDNVKQTLHPEQSVQADARQLVDVSFYPAYGQMEQTETGLEMVLPGQFQMLYYDPEDTLCSAMCSWQERWQLDTAPGNKTTVHIFPTGRPVAIPGAGNVNLRAELQTDACVSAGQGIDVMTAMDLGETEKPDPNRPALILCRKGNRRLWDLAKENGSTVEKILQTNGLEAEPADSAVLLIPVS